VTVDFDGWPGNHTNLERYIRPYNGSLFQIRQQYRNVFPEPEFEPLKHDGNEEGFDQQKIYKIKYSVNLLP